MPHNQAPRRTTSPSPYTAKLFLLGIVINLIATALVLIFA